MGTLTPYVLEIPVTFVNNPKGAKHLLIDPVRLPYFLQVGAQGLEALRKAGLIQPETNA